MPTKAEMIRDGDVTQTRNGVRLVLTSYTPLITTEQELYDFCGVDIKEWTVENLKLNAWTTPSKDRTVDLEYDGGAATGSVKQSNDMRFGQNVQVKVTLIPKKVAPIHPMIQPIEFVGKFKRPKPPKRSAFTRHLIFGDPHFGFTRRVHDAKLTELHDRAALDIVVQIAAYAKPNRIDILGDLFDMAEFGKYLKEPKFYYTLQPAVYEAFFWLLQLVELCDNIRAHEGNHDKRLPDAIKKYFPFAYGLRRADLPMVEAPPVLSVQNLLALDKLGIEWVDKYPNDADQIAPRLLVNHGLVARSGPIETANAVARGDVSEIYGHIHKRQYSVGVRTDATGRQYEVVAHSPGCTCHTDQRLPGHTRKQEWSKGLSIVDVFPDGAFSITPIAINDGVAYFSGLRFTARDRIDEIKEARPDWGW
jgi:hypothetical protein